MFAACGVRTTRCRSVLETAQPNTMILASVCQAFDEAISRLRNCFSGEMADEQDL
jgi:hypothetical protein